MGKKTYYCNRCKHRHRYTSNKGKKHLEFKNTGRGTKDKYTYKSLSPIQKKIVDISLALTKEWEIDSGDPYNYVKKHNADLKKILSFLITKGEFYYDNKRVRKGIRIVEKKNLWVEDILDIDDDVGYKKFDKVYDEYNLSKEEAKLIGGFDSLASLTITDPYAYLNKAKKYGFNKKLQVIN